MNFHFKIVEDDYSQNQTEKRFLRLDCSTAAVANRWASFRKKAIDNYKQSTMVLEMGKKLD